MNDLILKLNGWRPYMLSVLRIMSGLIFLAHGTGKLLGFPTMERVPEAFGRSWFAGVIELVFGFMIVIGFQTRLAAFISSGTMAFAYFLAHAPRSFYPLLNNGDAAILYCFVFLYFVFAGAGPWSVDALRRKA